MTILPVRPILFDTMSDDLLSDLNEQQLAAVTHGEGPLLV